MPPAQKASLPTRSSKVKAIAVLDDLTESDDAHEDSASDDSYEEVPTGKRTTKTPASKAPAAKRQKQPKITKLLGKRGRDPNADEADDDDEDENEEEEQVTPVKRGRGRPPKVAAVPAASLFDDSLPDWDFSLTISKKKAHIPLVWFNAVTDWQEERCVKYDTSTERGGKEENLHIQSTVGL